MQGRSKRAYTLENHTVLLTGATGFLGSHLLEVLRTSGARILALSRRHMPARRDDQGVQWVVIPQWSPHFLRQSLAGATWTSVIQAASYGVSPLDRTAEEMVNINVSCAAAIAGMSSERNVSAYIHVGSSSEYASAPMHHPLGVGSPLEVGKLYGTSKACGTMMCHAIASASGMAFAAARLFNIYGPGEPAHRLLPTLVQHLSVNRVVPLSSGEQIRDFCFVADAAVALVDMLAGLCSDKSRTGIYNVCSGQGITVREFALLATRAMDRDEALLDFGRLSMRPDESPYVVGDPSRTNEQFGWTPTTPLSEGIRHSVSVMRREA